MEILDNFKSRGYFTADVYHLIANKKYIRHWENEEITPMQYMKEMCLSTSDRIQNCNDIVINNQVADGKAPGPVILSFTPRIILFQNYQQNEKYTAKFTVKNITNTPTHISMVHKESSYFAVRAAGGQTTSRLAPGIAAVYCVAFLPRRQEDCVHQITFFTDADRYVLPILALGPRPLLGLPDALALPPAPLKLPARQQLVVANVGKVAAAVTFRAKCPFTVWPTAVYLKPDEKAEVTVTLQTMHAGDVQGKLHVILETGELFTVRLAGSAAAARVELERCALRFDDTFVTLARRRALRLTNKSPRALTFVCMKNPSVHEDFEEKVNIASSYMDVQRREAARDGRLRHYDVAAAGAHARAFARVFADEVHALVADETLLFRDRHFAIEPIQGTVWPNSSTDLTVTFAPQAIGEWSACAHVDVDGAAGRLPLRVAGSALPPRLALSLDTLDLDRLYINKTYHFEIVASNKGHIPGKIVYDKTPTVFKSVIDCEPKFFCLSPGEMKTFVISFSNSHTGPFFEEIFFKIQDTSVVLKICLKGEIIYPSLRFSVPCLDFGVVNLGVPKSLRLGVENESGTRVRVALLAAADGPELNAATLADHAAAAPPKPALPLLPKEFRIRPHDFWIDAHSRNDIEVTLTANVARDEETRLEMEIQDSDSPAMVVPVRLSARAPRVSPAPPVRLRVCFIDYSYHEVVRIVPDDNKGYFVVDESELDNSTLKVDVKVKEGYLEPNTPVDLPVEIRTSHLDWQEYTIRIKLFGDSRPVDICHVSACGVTPIVSASPAALHWGQARLLTHVSRALAVVNDSPVDVRYKCSFVNDDKKITVHHEEGVIEAETELNLTLTLFLVDAGTYKNKLKIHLERVKDILVPLSAVGAGTSVTVGEHGDRVDLGRHFTRTPLHRRVPLVNHSTRLHLLEWTSYVKPPKTKEDVIIPFFTIEPRVIKIGAGEKIELNFTCMSNKPVLMTESWYLTGSIEGINKKELLMECRITAEFVEPTVIVNPTSLNFQYDYGPYNECYKLTDVVTIKNVSKLRAHLEIVVRPPFALVLKKNPYRVDPDEQHCACLQYRASDLRLGETDGEPPPPPPEPRADCHTQRPLPPVRDHSLDLFQDIHKLKRVFHLTNNIDEVLEDEEIIKIQIIFDTTKHTTLKSKIYCDQLVVKFRNHKKKDGIKLTGKINFPNLLVFSPRLDFQCILNGSVASKVIKIQNVTPLMASYRLYWKEFSVLKTEMAEQFEQEDQEYLESTASAESSAKVETMASKDLTDQLETEVAEDNVAPKEETLELIPMESRSAASSPAPEVTGSQGSCRSEERLRRLLARLLPMLGPTTPTAVRRALSDKLPPRARPDKIDTNEILVTIPHRGMLRPNEIQNVQVICTPRDNVRVRAVLVYEVLGGPSESVLVTAVSSPLRYSLSVPRLNYRIRSFHERATEVLEISNTAYLPFQYTTYVNETGASELQGRILEVSPAQRVLGAGETEGVRVAVAPGVLGRFTCSLALEVGHHAPVPVQLCGWGVLPQLYFNLPKLADHKLPAEVGYRAIQPLTAEYLEARAGAAAPWSPGEPEPRPRAGDDVARADSDLQGWHICSSLDMYPTKIDIEMGLERHLVVGYIRANPEVLSKYLASAKATTLPGYRCEPYLVDYGVVITGSVVHRWVEVVNYGPAAVRVAPTKGARLPPWLALQAGGALLPGERGRLLVKFSPTPDTCPELEQRVEALVTLDVPNGICIPIKVTALSAVPYLVSTVTSVDFGAVRCGNKTVCSIPLKNIGMPTCIWCVTLRLKAVGPNPLVVMDTSGRYEPGEGGFLRISFKPTMEMVYEGLLVFRFHMNVNRMTIPVRGAGVVPRLQLLGARVAFPPTLPWARHADLYFGLANPCPVPVEVIVPCWDEEWVEEEQVLALLNKYYNKPAELLAPAAPPGAGLRRELVAFYHNYLARVKKAKDEMMASMTKSQVKAPKGGSKSKSPKHVVNAAGPKMRTEVEIIADVLAAMKRENVDPIEESRVNAFEKSSLPSLSVKYDKGVMIFFHGSPSEDMDALEMAYTVGNRLRLPTLGVDALVIEALCAGGAGGTGGEGGARAVGGDEEAAGSAGGSGGTGDAGGAGGAGGAGSPRECLLTLLDEVWSADGADSRERLSGSVEFREAILDTDDEFDIMKKKIDYLVNKLGGGKMQDKKKTTKGGPAHPGLGTTTVFNMEILEQLLTEHLARPKFDKGFVIESLSSCLLRDPALALTTLLRCKRAVRNAHLVLCHSVFAKWLRSYDEAQKHIEFEAELRDAPRTYSGSELEALVARVEAMDADEYERCPAEERALYVAHGLAARRERHLERHYNMAGLMKKLRLDQDGSGGIDKGTQKRSISLAAPTDTKKVTKLKKDDEKKPTKQTPEVTAMGVRFAEYKNTYESLTLVAANWLFAEGELAAPACGLSGQPLAGGKKTRRKSEMHIQTSQSDLEDRGFPLIIVNSNFPSVAYKQALSRLFRHSPTVVEALAEPEPADVLRTPLQVLEYSVLAGRAPPPLQLERPLDCSLLETKKRCQCNDLLNCPLDAFDDSTQENVLNIMAKWHCECDKQLVSAQTSPSAPATVSGSGERVVGADPEPPPPPRGVTQLPEKMGRIVLEPYEMVRCKYSYGPEREGVYMLKHYFDVAGWPESRCYVSVFATCTIPRIDKRPKKMFQNFVRRTVEGRLYKSTYLDDQKIFEFGPIFVGQKRVYEEQYTIDLRNPSLMVTDVVMDFIEVTTVFELNKEGLVMEPGGRDAVTVSAAPAETGAFETRLLLSVRDNPEVVAVAVACTGVLPVVEILPVNKVIDYGKLLLYRREEDRFIVKNDSVLPIMWRIRNAEDFADQFLISASAGVVPAHDNEVVPITYIACEVGHIVQKPLIIEIYDALGRGEPMLAATLHLSAECYDVLVECAFESPADHHLNYGNVKVNSTEVREMYLMNRGKYNIYYKLKKVKDFPAPSLLKSMEVSAECGLLAPGPRLVAVQFACTPSEAVALAAAPAYTCTLLDGTRDQVVVANFPVCVTLASFYNTFTLFPLGELNFHIIPVGAPATRELILNNTSKCPFTYDIVLPEAYEAARPPPAAAAHKGKGVPKNAPLRCGNFLISNEDNLLAPGMSRSIQITFVAGEARKYEETVKFVVSDTCPAEACGVPLRLVGVGGVPTLDLWNVENTFREHFVVKTMAECKVIEEHRNEMAMTTPHCIFAEDTVTLHFFCVIVDTTYTAYIDLYNNGVVTSPLQFALQHQSNTDGAVFSLTHEDMHIQPLEHKRLGIVFAPRALEDYRSVLEIRLRVVDNQSQSFKICLSGGGVLPRVELVSPRARWGHGAQLRVPPAVVGAVSQRRVVLRNTSCVAAAAALRVVQPPAERDVFTLYRDRDGGEPQDLMRDQTTTLDVVIGPDEKVSVGVVFNPLKGGKIHCEVLIDIKDNPYEPITIHCETEAFMEDIILLGLEMLPSDLSVVDSSGTSTNRKVKSALTLAKSDSKKKSPKASSTKQSQDSDSAAPLKYLLDFGGTELNRQHKRTVVMVNNSERVYRFSWASAAHVLLRPALGYLSPAEEKDLDVVFCSNQIVDINKEPLYCQLVPLLSDFSTFDDARGTTWDNRQIKTKFIEEGDLRERSTEPVGADDVLLPEELEVSALTLLYSVKTEYTKYTCDLPPAVQLADTYVFQTRTFEFTVKNTGSVSLDIKWYFQVEEDFPARIDKINNTAEDETEGPAPDGDDNTERSKETLFSGSAGRRSVDTWFEADLPFSVAPARACLPPRAARRFTLSFAPTDAFRYSVRLNSHADNLDPYDENASCKLTATSLIPYCHLALPATDYLASGRREAGPHAGAALPPHTAALAFHVLGAGCYRKTFDVVNPTDEPYEFLLEPRAAAAAAAALVPVHSDTRKGWVEAGAAAPVTFTFAPTAPGTYESLWSVHVHAHGLELPLLVVGEVREPAVMFLPTMLLIRNSLVGFTTESCVSLHNAESEPLQFTFAGNSLCNELGATPVVMRPGAGVLRPHADTPVKLIYTPVQDGPVNFKVYCSVQHLTKPLVLCVNALSYMIKPKVTYTLVGCKHTLDSDVITNIHLDQTASGYTRTVTFTVANEGSAAFAFSWEYRCAAVAKYLTVEVTPRAGHVPAGGAAPCTLSFTLRKVPVHKFPLTLQIKDGPEYFIQLYSEVEKPRYRLSCTEHDFGPCIVDAPDNTYRKKIAVQNLSELPIIFAMDFANQPELMVQLERTNSIEPGARSVMEFFFRPKEVKEYEFKIQCWINSLCEEHIYLKGVGVALMFDLYEGCDKSFDLGPVQLGASVVREVHVINHSRAPITGTFLFRAVYPTADGADEPAGSSACLTPTTAGAAKPDGPSRVEMLEQYRDEQTRAQIDKDAQNALASLRVTPRAATLRPHQKVAVRVQFKPAGLISRLMAQLSMKVFDFERPLVLLSGSATGLSLRFNQTSLQFGRVRRRGCKVMKVLLLNEGDFGARFWWQPLTSDEFTISPQQGQAAARANVTFTITYRPKQHNPFVKVWASCNIEKYQPLEIAMYASCIDSGAVESQVLQFSCPVRSVQVEHVTVTNSSEDLWLVLSEMSGQYFETPPEFQVEPNTRFTIPISFRPQTMGTHEARVLFTPLGESALFLTLVGQATNPLPAAELRRAVTTMQRLTEHLEVQHMTASPEAYVVLSELLHTAPERYDGHYEVTHAQTVAVWGGTAARCRWDLVVYEPCEMAFKISFVNVKSKEYQFYLVNVSVSAGDVVGTVRLRCRARESTRREVALFNPLSAAAEFTLGARGVQCSVQRITIGAHARAKFSEDERQALTPITLTYSPLLVGETQEYLEVSNPLAGTYRYLLLLRCDPAPARELAVTAALGAAAPVRLRVHNRADAKADFVVTVSHPSVQSEREYSLGPGERGKLQCWFEPTQPGEQRARVVCDSPVAGEFVFNILGTATEPTPQGPFEIKPGGFITIKFKNVFTDTRTFKITVDNAVFYVKSMYEQIKSKKDVRITVYMLEAGAGGAAGAAGALAVETLEPPEPRVQWKYFLKAVP